MEPTHTTNETCTTNGCKSANYCLIAKTLVAIPAIPMLAALAASFSTSSAWQFTIASYTGAAIVLIAQRIDRLKLLAPMVRSARK